MDLSFVAIRFFKPLEANAEDFALNGTDYLGVPTLTSLAFKWKDFELVLLECIVTINQEKNIVSTPMQGRDGTIKEYISDGDYTITIDAAVSNYNESDPETSKSYPIEKIKTLIGFLKLKESFEVQSDFLTLFGIYNIVVKSYGMVQETHSNRQSFQIQCLSDTPYEIKILEDAQIN